MCSAGVECRGAAGNEDAPQIVQFIFTIFIAAFGTTMTFGAIGAPPAGTFACDMLATGLHTTCAALPVFELHRTHANTHLAMF